MIYSDNLYVVLYRMALAALHYNENSMRVKTGYAVRYPKFKQGLPAVRAMKSKPRYSK